MTLPPVGPEHRFSRILAALSRVVLRANIDSRPRLEHLLENLSEVPMSAKRRAATVGRILHHIQDMACPPHAVAVWHLGADKYEAGLGSWLDSKGTDSSWVKMSAQVTLTGTVRDAILKLYEQTATQTRQKVRSTPIPLAGVEATLAYFWTQPPAYAPDARNGRYGPEDKDRFGDKVLAIGGKEVSTEGTDLYADLYEGFSSRAVSASVDALRLLLP